ncbi:MAG: DsrE family protein [Planctomycetota bacterium]
MSTLIVIKRNQLGEGDPALGQAVLGTFLRKAIAVDNLSTIVFFNSGVNLVCADSPVLAELTMLEERGVDILPCGTCAKHYGVEPAVGKISNMDDIIHEINQATKIIDL